jgi:hypothetical protein
MPGLAREGLSATTPLGIQAVATRALYEHQQEGTLSYFGPVAGMPGFPKALARTLEDLALAGITAKPVRRIGDSGPDLAALFERFDVGGDFFRLAGNEQLLE